MTFSTSQTTAKIDAALVKAQAAFTTATKDKVNPHFRSKYADLGSIFDACKAALAANDISVSQWLTHADDARLHMVTRLGHAGEWMMAEASIPASKQDPQGYGSAATYLRRFALSAALGIVADDDDDGNAGSRPAPPQQRAPDVTRDRHFGNAAEEIRSGQNGTPASARKVVTVQSDPAAWVASEDGKGFMREARADLTMVRTFEELKKWEHANRAKLDAFDEHGAALTLKDGRTYKAFMDDLMADAYDAIKASAGNLRAAG